MANKDVNPKKPKNKNKTPKVVHKLAIDTSAFFRLYHSVGNDEKGFKETIKFLSSLEKQIINGSIVFYLPEVVQKETLSKGFKEIRDHTEEKSKEYKVSLDGFFEERFNKINKSIKKIFELEKVVKLKITKEVLDKLNVYSVVGFIPEKEYKDRSIWISLIEKQIVGKLIFVTEDKKAFSNVMAPSVYEAYTNGGQIEIVGYDHLKTFIKSLPELPEEVKEPNYNLNGEGGVRGFMQAFERYRFQKSLPELTEGEKVENYNLYMAALERYEQELKLYKSQRNQSNELYKTIRNRLAHSKIPKNKKSNLT